MAHFYDPSTSTVTGSVFFRLDFFGAAPDMRDIVSIGYALMCSSTHITFVGAEMLRLAADGFGRLMTMLAITISS
jgi:hypothetical protein